MLIDTNDLVAATDFNRNTGRYTNLAAEGRRIVIMKDQKIIAALIGIHDLNRLDALDTVSQLGFDDIPETSDGEGGETAPTPANAVLPIGLTAGGAAAHVNPFEDLLVVGRGASELMGVLVMRAGELAESQQFAIGSANPACLLPNIAPDAANPSILTVSTDMSFAAQHRFAEQIAGELQRRTKLLRESSVNTVEQYRLLRTDPTPPKQLTVALDGADDLLGGPLSEVITEIIRRGPDLGVNLWLFSDALPSGPAMRMAAISQRLALHLPTGFQSREVIGTDAAAHLKPRQAVLRNIDQSLTPVVTPTATPPFTPAAPTAPTADQWPVVPQPEPIESIVDMWSKTAHTGDAPSVPLGLVDDTADHRYDLFALGLHEGGHTIVITPHPEQTTLFVKTLLTAAALTDPGDVLFHYLGTRAPRTTTTLTSQTYEDLRSAGRYAVQSVATALSQAAAASPTAVCLIVNVQELTDATNFGDDFMLKPFIRDLLEDTSTRRVHVVLLSNDIFRLQTHLHPSTRMLRATACIYYAGTDHTVVARGIRDQVRQLSAATDHLHHAIATDGGQLCNESNGVHLILADTAQ